jgi:hypothetical protein
MAVGSRCGVREEQAKEEWAQLNLNERIGLKSQLSQGSLVRSHDPAEANSDGVRLVAPRPLSN